MKLRKSALMTLLVFAVVAALGLVITLTGEGIRFYSQSVHAGELVRMAWAMVAVVVMLTVFGLLRYDAAGGVALGVAALTDQLLTLALAAIGSLAFAQTYSLPALVAAAAVYTCCFSIPVLREARLIGRSLSQREHTRDEVAGMGVKAARPVMIAVLVVSLLIFVAFVVSGSTLMLGFMLPMLAGILAACLTVTLITPYVWAAMASRRPARR